MMSETKLDETFTDGQFLMVLCIGLPNHIGGI